MAAVEEQLDAGPVEDCTAVLGLRNPRSKAGWLERFDAADDVELLELLRPQKRTRTLPEDPAPGECTAAREQLPVTLGPRTFPSLDAVRRFLNDEVLKSLMPGEEVTGDAAGVLGALFQHHPRRDEKLGGQALAAFLVRDVNVSKRPGGQALQKCFWLRRADGAEDDFSVNRCLDGLRGTPGAKLHEQEVAAALVDAVHPHLRWCRNYYLKRHPLATCRYSGAELSHRNAIAVNEPPLTMARLIRQWLEAEGIGFADVQLKRADAGSPVAKTLASHKLLQRWKHHFATHSQLVVVSRDGYRDHALASAMARLGA